MSKTWYGHHIETIKGEDYVLFKDYLELDKEIERLKAREQECIDKYLNMSKYASEMEGKYITEKYIIDELEKLIDEYDLGKYDYSIPVFILKEKINELKEGK